MKDDGQGADRRREIFGFMMFDFANSSYTTVIVTAVFNAYFVQVVVDQGNRGELLWAVALSVSYLLVMLLGPVLGAMADYTGAKKRFLLGTYLLCVVFTGLLFLVKPGDVVPAMVFVVLSNFGYASGENFVSSFLPDIAGPRDMGRISGYAWAFGYVGGILSLVLSLLLITGLETGAAGGADPGAAALPVRLTFLMTAGFFALAALPTFLWLRERRRAPAGEGPVSRSLAAAFRASFGRLAATCRKIGAFREMMKFLVSFLMFNSGIQVVVAFAAIFAQKELGFTPGMTVVLIIVVNITAAAGAFLFGMVQDRIGPKKTVLVTLLIWITTVIAAYFIGSREQFWIVANLAGLAMGASQASARALVGLFSPPSKSAEFFGFWGFSGKLSAILGILTFGALSYRFASNRLAILSTVFFFFFGIVFLLLVDEERGRKAVVEYTDERS
jgi:UMF1 family MFS transporter